MVNCKKKTRYKMDAHSFKQIITLFTLKMCNWLVLLWIWKFRVSKFVSWAGRGLHQVHKANSIVPVYKAGMHRMKLLSMCIFVFSVFQELKGHKGKAMLHVYTLYEDRVNQRQTSLNTDTAVASNNLCLCFYVSLALFLMNMALND